MIYVGLDDTDTLDSPGTNKVARALAVRLANRYRCLLIIRHQLLLDRRVPYTSKNSSASLLLEPHGDSTEGDLLEPLRGFIRERFVAGSDPGICVTSAVPEEVVSFGRRCQQELVNQAQARDLAARHGLHLEGLGGTEDGVVGALAAVGLAAEGNDGRVVQIGTWSDDMAGWQDVETVRMRGVDVRCAETGDHVHTGFIDVGKHLRPNYRQKEVVLFAQPDTDASRRPHRWSAIRLT